MNNLILSTPRARIIREQGHYKVTAAVGEIGKVTGWLAFAPFPESQEGLCSALSLALDIESGRFYAVAVAGNAASEGVKRQLDGPRLLK